MVRIGLFLGLVVLAATALAVTGKPKILTPPAPSGPENKEGPTPPLSVAMKRLVPAFPVRFSLN